MIHQLRKAAPGVDFRAVNERASCKYMKMITPEKLLRVAAGDAGRGASSTRTSPPGRAAPSSG